MVNKAIGINISIEKIIVIKMFCEVNAKLKLLLDKTWDENKILIIIKVDINKHIGL